MELASFGGEVPHRTLAVFMERCVRPFAEYAALHTGQPYVLTVHRAGIAFVPNAQSGGHAPSQKAPDLTDLFSTAKNIDRTTTHPNALRQELGEIEGDDVGSPFVQFPQSIGFPVDHGVGNIG